MGSIDPKSLAPSLSAQSSSPAHEARLHSRHNLLTNTSGRAPNYLQANLLILPSRYAGDFHDLCLRNPVACPLLGITSAGNPHAVSPKECIRTTADFDIRTDFPAYRVYEKGKLKASSKPDLLDSWTDEHVGFLIGCSYSFEDALCAAGLQPRHQRTGKLVSMYRTNISLLPAGIFTDATFIVSMRPYKPEEIEKVRDVCRPYLATHGEPVAWGWDGAKAIGVGDIASPDFGDAQLFENGEVPVFWVSFSSSSSSSSSSLREVMVRSTV